ncbi:DUF5979 domain-containing protein [Leifsonia shinshuensis]
MLAVAAGLVAAVVPGLWVAQPAFAVTGVNPIAECVLPVSGGTGPGTTWDALFGWESQGPDGELTIPQGPQNQVTSGTVVSGPLPTTFTKPARHADGTLRDPVWPPQYISRTGRTQWWPDADVTVRVTWGQSATWSLGGKTATITMGDTTQRCSHHLFLSKTWNGSLTPPADLDFQAFQLSMRMLENPQEPTVVNSGVAQCRYQQIVPLAGYPAGMPYGASFVVPAAFSPTLKCVYTNAGLPFTTDSDGLWIPKGGTYVVDETGLPPGWQPGTAVGVPHVADYQDPTATEKCTYYPGYGTPAATPDIDGSTIPEFGRASNKWCVQAVDNLAAQVSVTKSVQPATAQGWAFDFTLDPAPLSGPATLTATSSDPTVTWSDLDPAQTYTVSEAASPGFAAGPVVCPGGRNTVHPSLGTTAACRVTNLADATLSVTKTVSGASAPADWGFDFTLQPAPSQGPATQRATAAAPTVTFAGLVPGRTYTVTEAAVPGFTQVSLSCAGGGASVTPAPGAALSCQAVNDAAAGAGGGSTTELADSGSAVVILPLVLGGAGAVVLGAGILLLRWKRAAG